MSLPPSPTMALPQPQPQQGGSGISDQLMRVAQGAMSSPAGQPVPQPSGGGIDSNVHPAVASFIKALSQAAQSFGWTAMMPDERVKRTELNQQKADTMARLAQTGEYQQGELKTRRSLANSAQENAETRRAAEESETKNREFMQTLNASKLSLAQDQNTWKQATAQGRLDVAHSALDQRAKRFEQMFQVRAQEVGIEQAKLELGQEANAIRAGMVDVARESLAQRGTVQGAQLQEKIASWDRTHWAISSVFGSLKDDLGGVTGMNANTSAAPMPGVPQPTAAPVAPNSSTTPKSKPARTGDPLGLFK